MKSSIILSICILISSCSSNTITDREPASFKTCLNIVSTFFKNQPSELEIETERLLSKIELNDLPKISSLHNRDDMIFYSIVNNRPELLNLLRTYPANKKDQIIWKKIISSKIEKYHDSALFNFVDFLDRRASHSDFNAFSFLEKQKNVYEKLDQQVENELLKNVSSFLENQDLQTFYRSNFFVNLNHDEEFIYIGEERFKYIISKNEIIIEVPRTKVKSPAWNPLTKVQRDKIIQNNPPPPAVYDTTLGLDGNFYLLDGNHRFHLRETKTVVKVKLSEFKTSSLSIYLDLVGASQLKTDEIKLIFNQERPVKEILPENVSKKIIWNENDFVRN